MSAIRTSVLGWLEANPVWASGPRVAEAVALRRETVRDHLLATAAAVEPPRLAKYRNSVAWTETAPEGLPEPGKTVVYHVGDLATDRAENGPLSVRADALWKASESGLVLLSQERVGPNRTVYRATGIGGARELPDGVKHRSLMRKER